MVKLDRLKGKLTENKATYEKCSKQLNITKPTFVGRMNGKSDFTVSEVKNLSDYLNLTLDERIDIFMS